MRHNGIDWVIVQILADIVRTIVELTRRSDRDDSEENESREGGVG